MKKNIQTEIDHRRMMLSGLPDEAVEEIAERAYRIKEETRHFGDITYVKNYLKMAWARSVLNYRKIPTESLLTRFMASGLSQAEATNLVQSILDNGAARYMELDSIFIHLFPYDDDVLRIMHWGSNRPDNWTGDSDED